MRVSHNEGLATHVSPESCGGYGNVLAEALTGESTGGLLSSENTFFRVPTLWSDKEGNMRDSDRGELLCNPAESKNLACVEASHTGIGRSGNTSSGDNEEWSRKGINRTLEIYVSRKSDNNIVPKIQANKVVWIPLRSLRREGR